MTELEKFKYIFTGLDRAYGLWLKGNKARTLRKPLNDLLWENHLNGSCGLGIVPIQSNNKCRFGAIDIDQDGINLVALEEVVRRKNFPLIVCRSKSGGAHLYYFADPPVPAIKIRKKLSGWAGKLGFGKSEIFPKQEKLTGDEIGNWINLPYFNAEETERYAIYNGRQLSLPEFLDLVMEIMASGEVQQPEEVTFPGMPPCLVSLLETGIPKGNRNEAMYNYAVYFKKSAPEAWEDGISKLNHSSFKPPLSNKEIAGIVKSVNKRDYGYKCSSNPIDMFCNRIECLSREFGVKNITDTYNDIMVSSITKVLTDPPRWIVEVNGIEITLTTEELMNYASIRRLCLERVDMVVPPMKVEEWLKLIKDRLTTKTVVEAPEDTGVAGTVIPVLHEFLAMHDRSKDKEDIVRGIPIRYDIGTNKVICFRSSDFISFMNIKKMASVSGPNLWMMMRTYGCGHTKIKIGDKTMQVWYAPYSEDGKVVLIPKNEEVEL